MRVLVCLDPTPAEDGTCANSAFVEQTTMADYMPTREDANLVGMSIFGAVLTVVAIAYILNPSNERED